MVASREDRLTSHTDRVTSGGQSGWVQMMLHSVSNSLVDVSFSLLVASCMHNVDADD